MAQFDRSIIIPLNTRSHSKIRCRPIVPDACPLSKLSICFWAWASQYHLYETSSVGVPTHLIRSYFRGMRVQPRGRTLNLAPEAGFNLHHVSTHPRNSVRRLRCPAFSLLFNLAHCLTTLWHALTKSLALKWSGIDENSTDNIWTASGYFAMPNM